MRKIFTVLTLIVTLLILDNALMPFISIKGIYPSILFLFIICYSIINGSKSAIIVGVISGFLQDIYLINGLGTNMLVNMVSCLIAAKIGETIFKDKSIIPVISCFFLVILKGTLMLMILYIFGQHIHFKVIIYRSLYSIPFAAFMYKRIYNLCQRPFMIKNWKF